MKSVANKALFALLIATPVARITAMDYLDSFIMPYQIESMTTEESSSWTTQASDVASDIWNNVTPYQTACAIASATIVAEEYYLGLGRKACRKVWNLCPRFMKKVAPVVQYKSTRRRGIVNGGSSF